jgi:ribosomal protein RSM22 (predicted rRNA methylase)
VIELASSDWERLRELRDAFLAAGTQGSLESLPDYWQSRRDLELYDCTFGARIGWKWRAVLDELRLRRLEPPAGHVVEWGCGTGVAARAYLRAFGADRVRKLELLDRSPAAEQFARERVREAHPDILLADELHDAATAMQADGIACDVLLLSHVLTELDDAEQTELLSLVRKSRWVVWVEPGSQLVSRRLSTLRDVLRDELEPLAPCTHDAVCGMLAEGQESDWCHHFARPPAEVHQSRHWAQVSQKLGIDLRSLPYSFLVLARRTPGAPSYSSLSTSTSSTARILGRPRMEKANARIDVCDKDGVHDWMILQREDKSLFKVLGDSAGELLIFDWRVEGKRVHEPRRKFVGHGGAAGELPAERSP